MIDDLKVGQKVVVFTHEPITTKRIGEVASFTKTQIKLTNGRRYMKSTWNEVGQKSYIRPASDGYIKNLERSLANDRN